MKKFFGGMLAAYFLGKIFRPIRAIFAVFNIQDAIVAEMTNRMEQYASRLPATDDAPSCGAFLGYDEIHLADRSEADEVLSQLRLLIERYACASVADLYDLVGYEDGKYTDSRWGWRDIRGAGIIRDDFGFKIQLPKAVPLEERFRPTSKRF